MISNKLNISYTRMVWMNLNYNYLECQIIQFWLSFKKLFIKAAGRKKGGKVFIPLPPGKFIIK
jgi:hypothetical protein